MKKRIFSIILALTALLLLGGCGEEEVVEKDTATPVEVSVVSKGSISAQNSVSGQVASGDQQSVFVATSARCTRVYVEEGDRVSAGQTICTLDISSILANYETLQKSYETARQSYEDQSNVLSQQVKLAEDNLASTQALFEIGAASQLEVDNAQISLDNAKAGMASALNQLEVSMKNYQASMTQLDVSLANIDRSGNVTAPVTGNIVSLSATENNFVSAQQPVVVIDSTADMEVTASVAESLVSKLSVGGRADVVIASAGKSFQGTISDIAASPNAQTRLYKVTVKIPANMTGNVISGMFADVTFYTDTQHNVVIIPTEAIQTGIDGSYVITLDSENLAHKVMVETGLVGDGVTEITSGLTGGERLVTVGQSYLSEGDPARIVSGEV